MRLFALGLYILAHGMCAQMAFAGFQGFNGDQDLKLFNKIKCSDGLVCIKEKDAFKVSVDQSFVVAPEAASSGTVAVTQSDCGKIFTNSAAATFNLPEATLGCKLTFVVGHASNLAVNPDDAEQIFVLTDSAGDSLIADAVGETLVLMGVTGGWAPTSASGTWTDSD